MGNYCCKDDPSEKKSNLHFDNKPQKLDPAMQEILKKAGKNEDKVIKIQAAFRGSQARKMFKDEKQPPSSQRSKENKPKANNKNGDGYTRDIKAPAVHLMELPDYSNPQTKATESKLGIFNYDQPPTPTSKTLIERGPYELDNGAVYVGEWTKDGLRHGKGMQVWKDGSKYEGYWKNDMANGKGRLIHSDGDVYEGDWLNDKAHGRGVYIHMDGAKYQGDWREDK